MGNYMYHQNQTTADIGPREFFGIHSTKSPLHNQGRLIAWNKNSRFRQREIFVYMSILTRHPKRGVLFYQIQITKLRNMERNFLLTIIVGCVIASFSNAVRIVGKIPLNSAAFANLYENPNAQSPSEKYDLLLSTFSGNPFTSGTVNLYRGIGQQIKNIGSVRKEVLANRMSWPNEVAGVPGLFRIYAFIETLDVAEVVILSSR